MTQVDVAIVGGGIAGLAAAYELSTRGVSFVVLEGGARAGGVILSEQIDGYVIDGGPDALLVMKPDGIALCKELGLGDRLVSTKLPRLAYIQRRGRLHPLPAGSVLGIPTRIAPFVRTTLFTWAGKLRMGAELFVPPRRDEDVRRRERIPVQAHERVRLSDEHQVLSEVRLFLRVLAEETPRRLLTEEVVHPPGRPESGRHRAAR